MRRVSHGVAALIGLLSGTAALGSQTYLIEELPGRALKAWSVGIDTHDNLYVADAINHRIDRFALVGGKYRPPTILPGPASGYANLLGVAIDGAGNVFAVDATALAVYEIADVAGTYQTAVALPAPNSGYVGPNAIAADAAGNVFVCDGGGNKVYKLTLSGGSYSAPQALPEPAGGYKSPDGVAVDAGGNVFVADGTGHILYRIARVSGNYQVPTSLPAPAGGYGGLQNVAIDRGGNVYAVDFGAIYRLAVAGSGYSAPSDLTAGENLYPHAVAVDVSGNVYVAVDTLDEIAKVGSAYSAPTVLAEDFSAQTSVAVDHSGNVFVADIDNHFSTYDKVYKVPLVAGAFGNAVPVAHSDGFVHPFGIAVDANDNLLVSDAYWQTLYRLGLSGGSYQAPTTLPSPAGSYTPFGTAVDAAGNVFVADFGTHAVYRIVLSGGTYQAPVALPAPGVGYAHLKGVALDKAGNVYATDIGNSPAYGDNAAPPPAIYRTAFSGGVYHTPTTIAAGAFFYPSGVGVDSKGNIYLADYQTLYVVAPAGSAYAAPVSVTAFAAGSEYAKGVAVDGGDAIYVADPNASEVIRITPDGIFADGFDT